jgi:hypothetical protein
MSEKQQPSFFQVLKSVFAGFFGVQSSRNRERDFTQGRPAHYVIIGLLFTLAFILTVWAVVRLVLHLAGV